jgi:hypothetical protein
MTRFSCGGNPEYVLVFGVVSVHGGVPGLCVLDSDGVQRVDSLATADLCLAGSRVVRLLGDEPAEARPELLFYDDVGVARYARLADSPPFRHLAWDGSHVIATCEDTVTWLSTGAEVTRTSTVCVPAQPGRITGVSCAADEVYVAITAQPQWPQERAPGAIVRVSDNQLVAANLDSPRQFMAIQDGWAVCNAGRSEFLLLDDSGHRRRSLPLNSPTQGLACSDDYYFVGESVSRKQLAPATSAQLCIVERDRLRVVERLAVPGTEITFLALVPQKFVAALRRGFRTNSYREAQYEAASLLRATGTEPLHLLTTTQPLPADACRVNIEADVPSRVLPGVPLRLSVRVQNRGTAVFASAPPYPVHLLAQWLLPNGGTASAPRRARLARAIPPGYTLESEMVIAAPPYAGQYRLKIGLVQDWVRYFEEVDPANCFITAVAVEQPAGAPAATPAS